LCREERSKKGVPSPNRFERAASRDGNKAPAGGGGKKKEVHRGGPPEFLKRTGEGEKDQHPETDGERGH